MLYTVPYRVKRVNPEVHKIYIRRIGFSLIRVHRQQIVNVTSSSDEVLLQQLKWPIEYLFIGMKVKDYHSSAVAATQSEHLDKWHTFHSVSNQTYNTTGQNVMLETNVLNAAAAEATLTIAHTTGVATLSAGDFNADLVAGEVLRVDGSLYTVETGGLSGVAVVNPVPSTISHVSAAGAVKGVTYQGLEYQTQRCAKTLNNLTIKAHGIPIYDNYPAGFFNSYTSYHYGGPNVNTPEDCGLAFVPFCLYPGTYQPSGHINVSRAREFYLNWDSDVVGSETNGSLVVIASAINFLLISDGEFCIYTIVYMHLAIVVTKITASPIHRAKPINCGDLSLGIEY